MEYVNVIDYVFFISLLLSKLLEWFVNFKIGLIELFVFFFGYSLNVYDLEDIKLKFI